MKLDNYKVVENGRYIEVSENKREYRAYPNPKDISHLMNIWFCEFSDTSKKDITLEESIGQYTRAHTGFTSIHPFFDGNGRLARLLSNIYMLKNGYLPLIISNENRDEYIKLLSAYNIHSKSLDNSSTAIIEKNSYFEAIYEFFKSEYKNSQTLLNEIKR